MTFGVRDLFPYAHRNQIAIAPSLLSTESFECSRQLCFFPEDANFVSKRANRMRVCDVKLPRAAARASVLHLSPSETSNHAKPEQQVLDLTGEAFADGRISDGGAL